MKFYLMLFVLVGCGGNYGDISNPSPDDLGPGPSDASTKDAQLTGSICCQITNDTVDDPVWNMGLYECDTDGGLSVGMAPWVCNINAEGLCGGDSGLECLSCDQPECHIGMGCLGINGTGTVTNCQTGSE